MTDKKVSVQPLVDEIKAIYHRMGAVKDPHHDKIQQQERSADWALSMFMLDFVLYDCYVERDLREGKHPQHNLTAKKRGPTRKGVES